MRLTGSFQENYKFVMRRGSARMINGRAVYNGLQLESRRLLDKSYIGMDAMNGMVGLILGDATYWLFIIPGLLLGMCAQARLSSTYGRYVRQGIASGMTGAEAARAILDRAGLHGMAVNAVPGHLTDHYDPTKKALFLSEENYYGRSIAAVGVAAHEAGHALQHKAAYAPLQLRMAMVPLTGIATQA